MQTFISKSFGGVGLEPIEVKKEPTEPLEIQSKEGSFLLDVKSWLPFASECYHVSKNIRDYLIIPCPTVISDIPNTNGDSISKKQMLRFVPEMGVQAYRTWVGKPTFEEHQNTDITKAKGVILDTKIRLLKGFGGRHGKLIELLAFDRSKDESLCKSIINKEINTYSIGMYYDSYTCSICGNTVGKDYGYNCSHTKPKQPTYQLNDGRLAYRHCKNIVGFETSAVRDPAYVVAVSDYVFNT